MDILWAALLGALQGFSEFLPISSSGHLALAQSLIPNFNQPGLLFDVLLHLGTLSIVLIFYRADVADLILAVLPTNWRNDELATARQLLLLLIIGTIPAAIIGVLFSDYIEQLFGSPRAVGGFLWITAIALVIGERGRKHVTEQSGEMNPNGEADVTLPKLWQGLVIGCAQAVALCPGVSRSGMTIAAGLFLGLPPIAATRFSLLLMIPAISGATVLSLVKLDSLSGINITAYIIGPLVAGIVGYVCIRLLISVTKNRRLIYFAGYCAIAGTVAIIFF